ncbi:MAG TPA: hypothetical protein VJU86_14070 [Pyrinomonadaceae bacterium]|nr:hypothetical protein [Pyrinomonadaceae bacterium]
MTTSDNLQEEQVIRAYFLGDLRPPEQDRIEERLLIDRDFFETSLVVEDEILDAYALGLLSEQEQRKLERSFLASPQQLHKLAFVKTLEQYVSEHDRSKFRYQAVTPTSPFESLIPRLLGQHKPLNSDRSSVALEDHNDKWERLLREAHANRELLATIMAHDWCGLAILVVSKSPANPISREDIALTLEFDEILIDETLERLLQTGLITQSENNFACSPLGENVLESVQTIFTKTP